LSLSASLSLPLSLSLGLSLSLLLSFSSLLAFFWPLLPLLLSLLVLFADASDLEPCGRPSRQFSSGT
jgi:hypothetical protein